MSSPFLAEVRMFGFNYAPKGWAFCNGQTLGISQNTALFSLLGVTYGGDGRSNFQLPNLQGAFPVTSGQGPGLSSYVPGQSGGTSTVTLNLNQVPAHIHVIYADATGGTTGSPAGAYLAQLPGRGQQSYGDDSSTARMASNALTAAGNDQAHNNLPPLLSVNYCIALVGIFPQRP